MFTPFKNNIHDETRKIGVQFENEKQEIYLHLQDGQTTHVHVTTVNGILQFGQRQKASLVAFNRRNKNLTTQVQYRSFLEGFGENL